MKVPCSVYIIGCGKLGARVREQLPADRFRFTGVRRQTAALPAGMAGRAADICRPGSLDFLAGEAPELVLATFTPAGRGPEHYRAGFELAMQNLLAGLGGHEPVRVIMVSSTRVYRERDGGWVDEESPLAEDDPRATAMVRAERLLLDSGLPASVVRLGGIYGDPRGRKLARVAAGQLSPRHPARFSNRIHREDAAGFLAHLLLGASEGAVLAPVYNGVDDNPALQSEVDAWLAEQLGVAPAAEALAATAAAATAVPSGHKRCRNRRLHQSGYRLRYPDYCSGYSAALERRSDP